MEALIPFFVNCKNHDSINLECIYCNDIINKTKLFNQNLKNISDSLKKMIHYDQNKINEIKINNLNFIKNNFNYQCYTKQILELLS